MTKPERKDLIEAIRLLDSDGGYGDALKLLHRLLGPLTPAERQLLLTPIDGDEAE